MEQRMPLRGPMRAALAHLAPYNAGLSADRVRERYGFAQVVKLASNESPLGPSPKVRAALSAALGDVALYPDPYCTALRAAIAAGLQVNPDSLVFGNGSEDLLSVLCRAFLDPGDRIVVSSPTFSVYADFAAMMGATVLDVPRPPDLALDVSAVCAAVVQKPKLLFLCNPNNPTGTAINRADFQHICSLAGPSTLIVADEAYFEYAVEDASYPRSLQILPTLSASWIVLRTFSKAYGLAGLRVGYGICSSPEIARQVELARTAFNVNHLAQVAALAAWDDAAHMAQAVTHNRHELPRLAAALSERGFEPARSATNFLFFDVRENARLVADRLIGKGVIVKPWGGAYGTYLRVTVGTAAENDAFLAALDDVLPNGSAHARQ
jgi:histidinol-phosphate aminotransferase